jgi:phosphoglycerol transferase MdoB-like AlkP superfamily enzyme
MLNRLVFCLIFFGMWMLYFLVARLIFVTFYFEKSSHCGFSVILQSFLQGLKLDLSASAYLSLLPFFLIAFSVWLSAEICIKIIKYYSFFVLLLLNILFFPDLLLYEHFNIRIDDSMMKYLHSPEDMTASASNTYIFVVLSLFIFINLFWGWFFHKTLHKNKKRIQEGNFLEVPFLLAFTALLIIPLRGGFQTSPINQSNVYFSSEMFANHAAVNFGWNFFHALNENSSDTHNPFVCMQRSEAVQAIDNQRRNLLNPDTVNTDVLNVPKPNIILIIWESFTAKFVQPLGGEKDISPCFNKLCKEGLLFTNFYANGDRTDKGLLAILSGYYPQPHKSIIYMPNKTKDIPVMSQSLKKLGYNNTFYCGANLNFNNMGTYLYGKEISKLISRADFRAEERNSKWGCYDHVLFNRIKEDLAENSDLPFFNIVLTLSSHEPFDIPGEYKFGKDNDLDLFRSSMAYTDEVIGDFIDHAKIQSWWENTLVIITADHGHRHPPVNEQRFSDPSRYHIPMLWLGGALKHKNRVNNNIGAQTDIVFSLLPLLGADNSMFTNGTDLFNDSGDHYAHYIFNRGFGTLTENSLVVYDYNKKKAVISEGKDAANTELLGKALTQETYQDFIER